MMHGRSSIAVQSMETETLRKKPACVLRRDAWLTELRQLEDRESLRPWLHKYGCFEKNPWSPPGMVHLDNLKELAKNFRLHKSIPNFFRDYTTEDSLVAVLKRYVRNNGAFLSVAPSVARARRAAHPQADNSGGFGGGGGDASHAVGQTTSMENNSVLDGAIVSGGMHAGVLEEFSSQFPADITTSSGDGGQHAQRLTTAGGGSIHTGVSSTEIFHFGGTAGGSVSQISAGKGSWVASANTLHAMGNGRGSRIGGNAPRRPLQPKRLTKGSIILNPNAGGRKLFGYSDADTTSGMIQMSRMGQSSHSVDRLHIIYQNQRAKPPMNVSRSIGETAQRSPGVGMIGFSGPGGGGEDRPATTGPASGARQGIQTSSWLPGAGTTPKQRGAAINSGLTTQRINEEGDGGGTPEDVRNGVWGDSGELGGQRYGDDTVGNDDYSRTLKIKAAQTLFRMSMESGAEMKLVEDGVVAALMKLVSVESVLAHRLISGCLANLTTTRDVTWALLQSNGHQVLSLLVNGVQTPDSTTLANVATALCRCSYETRNHKHLATEFNTAQALCYIMQRNNVKLKTISATGMFNICGLSSNMPELASKLDVYMLTLCSALEDLARNEKEAVQTFVCRGIQGLTSVPGCLSRIPDSGVVDLLLPLVKLNQKRPTNLARLASSSLNLADLQSAHAQMVKQKDMVTVLRLLSAHPKLVESCCVAAAYLSRTRELEAHLAPLATTLVEIQLPNEASVDCIAYFLQNVSRAYPLCEPSVSSWLAAEAGSASVDGQLACLSAIGHLIRHREDDDAPILKAGLMATLHVIVDKPSVQPGEGLQDSVEVNTLASAASSADEVPTVPEVIRPTSADSSSHAEKPTGGGAPTPTGSSSVVHEKDGALASPRKPSSAGNESGRVSGIVKMLAVVQQRNSFRGRSTRSGTDVLDRTFAVVTKVCFSLTLRVSNRPLLVRQGLPALCVKVLKATRDNNIQFMAVACIFSLAQSPELCLDIADGGAGDLALDVLARGPPDFESEVVLAQLAVLAEISSAPRFCRRLACLKNIDFLMQMAFGGSEIEGTPTLSKEVKTSSDSSENRTGIGGSDGTDDGGGSVEIHSIEEKVRHGVNLDGRVGVDEGVSSISRDGKSQSHVTQEPKISRFGKLSGANVKVTSPFWSSLRYCVVTISDHLGSNLSGGEKNRQALRLSKPCMIAKLIHIVCIVVLTSGPDEPLLGRCAMVMADWSISSEFAREMVLTLETGRSLSILMRSVTPATRVHASMVLCNIAASSHRKGESAIRNNDKSRVASDQPTTETGGDSNWLRTTDILGDIISGGLVRATAEVKGNLIKALNNLMYWKVTRTGLVTSSRMSDFFQLVHGYTPETRELVAEILFNLTCERRFQPALLEADITRTLLELMGPSQHAPHVPGRSERTSPSPGNFKTVGGGPSNTSTTGAEPDQSTPQVVASSMPGETSSSENAGCGGVGLPSAGTSTEAATIPTKASNPIEDDAGTSTRRQSSAVSEPGSVIKKLGPQGDVSSTKVVSRAVAGGIIGGDDIGGGERGRPSLGVRRNVLGALMNLTSSNLSHPKLDPSAVMSLLMLIMQDNPSESSNEDIAADLWVAWQAVVLQLSFVERYRTLIVYHGDGQVFQRLKLTNDPLSGESSVMSPVHDRAYKRLIMGTTVNIACEKSLFEELEGQVQVLREFLSEYEHEASGGCTSGGSTSGSRGGSHGGGGSGGSGGSGVGLNDGSGGDIGSRPIDHEDNESGFIGAAVGGSGGVNSESYLRGRDWVRHELCGKLVSNLFSSKSLRERLSKKPIAGIIVGLLCGPPVRSHNKTSGSSQQSNLNTPEFATQSTRSKDMVPSRSFTTRLLESNGVEGEASLSNTLRPEGCGERRPLLYGGGEKAAAIASKFLCQLAVLYAAEGGFELPQRSLEALVKIAHYYNYSTLALMVTTTDADHSQMESQGDGGNFTIPTPLAGTSPGNSGPYSCHDNNNNSNNKSDGGGGLIDKSDGHHQASTGSATEAARESTAEAVLDVLNTDSSCGDDTKNRYPKKLVVSADIRSPHESGNVGPGKQLSEMQGGNSDRPHQPPLVSPLRRSKTKPVVDDWYAEGRVSRGSKQTNPPEGGDMLAQIATAREITRQWVLAVGSLCSPLHSDLWTLMIDAGIIGALNTCLSSTALEGDNMGLAICASCLRNVSTATPPRSLSSERTAACFGATKRLFSLCRDQPQVRIDCAAAIVNFIDASHVENLEAFDVVGLLNKYCISENEGGHGEASKSSNKDSDGTDTRSAKLVRELAIYSLSKLCTRDFVLKGDRVIATITAMVDLNLETIMVLDDCVKLRVTPPLPPSEPWKFLQPNKDLVATIMPVLNRDSQNESSTTHGEARSGDTTPIENGISQPAWGEMRWELQAVTRTKELPEEPTCFIPGASMKHSQLQSTRLDHSLQDPAMGQTGGKGLTGGAGGKTTTPGVGSEEEKKEDTKGGDASSASVLQEAKPGAVSMGRKAPSPNHNLKATAARMTSFLSESSMAAAAFSSPTTGPVNLRTRILRNPILTAEDPPFEIHWLLNHSKVDRLRLFQESLGKASTVLSGRQSLASRQQRDGGDCESNPSLVEQQDGNVDRGREGIAFTELEEDAFCILTVPDDKWTSPDLPLEANKLLDKRPGSTASTGNSAGGSGRQTWRRTNMVQGSSTGAKDLPPKQSRSKRR